MKIRSLGDAFEAAGYAGWEILRKYDTGYKFSHILFLYYLGNVCGLCNTAQLQGVFSTAAAFALIRKKYRILHDLPSIPDPSTFGRVLQEFPPEILNDCLSIWLERMIPPMPGLTHVAADGKCMRGVRLPDGRLYNFNYQLVDLGLVLWSETVGEKTYEVTSLLDSIQSLTYGQKYFFTMDALSTQINVLWAVVRAGCHCALPIKRNQPTLLKKSRHWLVEMLFSGSQAMMKTVDIGDFTDDQTPGLIIENTTSVVIKDDKDEPYISLEEAVAGPTEEIGKSRSNVEKDPEALRVVESCIQHPEGTPPTSSNRRLAWVKFGSGYIKMAQSSDRYERRMYWLVHLESADLISAIGPDLAQNWEKVASLGLCVRFRAGQGKPDKDGLRQWLVTVSVTPVLVSCHISVTDFANLIREHWDVEKMHYILDTSFCEDICRVRSGRAPQNCAILKRAAFNTIEIMRQMDRNDAAEKGAIYKPRSTPVMQASCHYFPESLRKIVNTPMKTPFTSDSFKVVHIIRKDGESEQPSGKSEME